MDSVLRKKNRHNWDIWNQNKSLSLFVALLLLFSWWISFVAARGVVVLWILLSKEVKADTFRGWQGNNWYDHIYISSLYAMRLVSYLFRMCLMAYAWVGRLTSLCLGTIYQHGNCSFCNSWEVLIIKLITHWFKCIKWVIHYKSASN